MTWEEPNLVKEGLAADGAHGYAYQEPGACTKLCHVKAAGKPPWPPMPGMALDPPASPDRPS